MIRRLFGLPLILLLAACAAPPVTLYTLDVPPQGHATPFAPPALVIEISRVTLPDYLDTQDILVRHGAVLETSHTGRWASRLSLGATELLVGRLARSRPDALVTDQPQSASPAYRILIDISRLDLAVGSGATLEADWAIVPNDAAMPVRRDRTQIDVNGPVRTDRDVVALTTTVLARLAAEIDVTHLH